MESKLLPAAFDFQEAIPLWQVDLAKQEIVREFIFTNFKLAFEFMTQCAQYAEEIDHHPDWSNSWNKVLAQLSTHSAKGLTELDIQLAKRMDVLAQNINARPLRDPLH